MTAKMHSNTVCLHDSCLAVDINNQARQQVTFAMHQAESGSQRIVSQFQSPTHAKSLAEPHSPECVINRNVFET